MGGEKFVVIKLSYERPKLSIKLFSYNFNPFVRIISFAFTSALLFLLHC